MKEGRSVAVINTFFNQPENHISVLQEYMQGGSLKDVLETAITLNEASLRWVAVEVLSALKEVHTRSQKPYSALSPSQILLDREGNVKLGLGLRNKLDPLSNQFRQLSTIIGHLFAVKTRIRSPVVARTPFSIDNCCNSRKEENIFSDDVFETGLLILLAAVGNVQLLSSKAL